MQKFWSGFATVHPWHMVDHPTADGGTRKVKQYPRGADQWEGHRRVIAHQGAMRVVVSIKTELAGAGSIICAVPRVSDDFDADYERVTRFVSAVFFGEPTEGLDAAAATDASPNG